MKPYQRLLFLLILTGLLTFTATHNSVSAQNFTQGVYKTSEDYLQKHLTLYDEVKLGAHGYKGVLNGKKLAALSYKDADFWGFQTEDGTTYRINKKNNTVDRVITKGKVCMYAGMELVITLFPDGRIKSQDINAEKGTKFSEVFWISEGLDGEMMGTSVDNLSTLFTDDPALVEKVKKAGIDEKAIKQWLDIFAQVNGWIAEYDKAHK